MQMKNSFTVDPTAALLAFGLASWGHPWWGAGAFVAASLVQAWRQRPIPSPSTPPNSGESFAVGSLSGLRVLVVEDVTINQRLLSLLLNRLGCQTLLASNGKDALKVLEHYPIDVVLLDINMPEMNGTECLAHIRAGDYANPNCWSTPKVIMTTSSALGHYRETCLEAGADEFLLKPIRLDELRSVLAKVSIHAKLSPQEMAQVELLDRQILAELKTLGEPDFLTGIIEEACQDLPLLFEDLKQRFRQNNWGETVRLSHSLKGAAACVGASRVARIAEQLENSARQTQPTACQDLLDQLERNLPATFAKMGAYLKAG